MIGLSTASAAEERECADSQAKKQNKVCNAPTFSRLDGGMAKLYQPALTTTARARIAELTELAGE